MTSPLLLALLAAVTLSPTARADLAVSLGLEDAGGNLQTTPDNEILTVVGGSSIRLYCELQDQASEWRSCQWYWPRGGECILIDGISVPPCDEVQEDRDR